MIRRIHASIFPVVACCAIQGWAAASPLLQPHELQPGSSVIPAVVNCVTELAFTASAGGGDPFLDSEIDAIFTEPGGQEMRDPAFWAGGDRWKVRYAPRIPGRHTSASRSAKDRRNWPVN